MKINLIISLIVVCLIYSCTPTINLSKYPTDKKYENKYKDQLDDGSTLVNSWYHYTVEKTSKGKYVYKQYYPTTKVMVNYVSYMGKEMIIKDGIYINWFDNGVKYEEGFYKNDKKSGQWKYYNFDTGKLEHYGPYVAGEKEGKWNTLDSLGQLKAEFEYKRNLKNGVYKYYNQLGEVEEEGIYKNGEIKTLNYLSSERLKKKIEELPYMKTCKNEDKDLQKDCSMKTLLTSIYKNIKYPPFAREMGIEGSALLRFMVNKNGEMKDIRVMRGICKEIEEECLKVVKLIPEWNPGTVDAKAVDVYYNLPVKFRLE